MIPLQPMLQRMIMSNPRFQNPACQSAWQAFQNNDIQGLERIANNLCQQNGISLDDAKRQIYQKLNNGH